MKLPGHSLKQLLPLMSPTYRKLARALAKYESEADVLSDGWDCRRLPPEEPDDRTPNFVLIAHGEMASTPCEFEKAILELHADGIEIWIDQWERLQKDGDPPLRFNDKLTRVIRDR